MHIGLEHGTRSIAYLVYWLQGLCTCACGQGHAEGMWSGSWQEMTCNTLLDIYGMRRTRLVLSRCERSMSFQKHVCAAQVYVNGISCDLQPSASPGEAGSGAEIESVPSDATGGVAALLVTSNQALASNSIQVASATSVTN